MEHVHHCPCCGKEFAHDDRSRVNCPGPNVEWRCNACFLAATYPR